MRAQLEATEKKNGDAALATAKADYDDSKGLMETAKKLYNTKKARSEAIAAEAADL